MRRTTLPPAYRLRRCISGLLLGLLLAAAVRAVADDKPNFTRADVAYAADGATVDVFRPERPNGYGIVYIVSAGFLSSRQAIDMNMVVPLVDRGYTVFAVVHRSLRTSDIPQMIQDVHRAVRFIRHRAAEYGIDPQKLGVTGGSSGGFLALTLATQGGPGKPDAADPVDRETSTVQAVACFYPVTDLASWHPPEGQPSSLESLGAKAKAALGPGSETAEGRAKLERELSPLAHVDSRLPPILIIHGDADRLVPLHQAEAFEKKAREGGGECTLIVRRGEGHGWKGQRQDLTLFADWFDEHLRDLPPRGLMESR